MERIARASAMAVAVPLNAVASMSTRTVRERQYVLVEIESETGLVGTGFTYTGDSGGLLVADLIDTLFAPILCRHDVADVSRIGAALYQEALLIGRRGAVLRAISAVDIALHDYLAKRSGVSLARYLGGSVDTVPAYASGGYYRGGEPVQEVEADIVRNLELGFSDHKIKVGGLPIDQDARRVAVARELIGEGGRLALDANNAYRTSAEAILAVRAFERAAAPGGLWWIEEPLSPDDIRGHGRVASVVDTPVATGEIHQTIWDFQQLIDAHAFHINQADAAVVGGVSEWMRIAALSGAAGIPMAPHWHANLHVQIVAAVTNMLTIEYFDLAKDIFNFERLLVEESRLAPANGRIAVPDVPGIGVTFDPGVLARHRIGR